MRSLPSVGTDVLWQAEDSLTRALLAHRIPEFINYARAVASGNPLIMPFSAQQAVGAGFPG